MWDTQASFSPSVKNDLRRDYSNRCAICLLVLPVRGIQCAHLFDSSSRGAQQVSWAQGLSLLPDNFQRNSVRNGFVQCPTCHIAFFTPDHVVLSPAIPVLNYINDYLANAAPANRLPVHEVLRRLRTAARGLPYDLPQDPNPAPALPYVDLFSLVILNPTGVDRLLISTAYLPKLHSLQNGLLRPVTTRTTRSATEALIFDVAAAGDATVSTGIIPLSPEQDGFDTQRYWRLPIDAEIVFALFIERVYRLPSQSPQAQIGAIHLGRLIYGSLYSFSLQRGGGHGGGGGRGGGGGGNIGNAPAKPLEKGEPAQKKPRTEDPGAANEDLGLRFFIEEIDKRSRDQSLVSSCERPHYGVDPKEWVVTTPFSTLPDGEPQAKAHSGYSTCNRESDCGEDNPREWRFGPSFTSNMIIATARQMMDM